MELKKKLDGNLSIVQLLAMTLVTKIIAMMGFLTFQAWRAYDCHGSHMGLFGGYSSPRLYKMFKETEWKMNTLKTAFMFPTFFLFVHPMSRFWFGRVRNNFDVRF